MNQINAKAIILSRTDYGEADRIINFLTPNHGKISAIAKSVRKIKSKLAGSLELFSISEISLVSGRGELYTVTSARLINHFDSIVKNLESTNTGYELIRLLNKATENNVEAAYFDLLAAAFESLDNPDFDPQIADLWFKAQLIKLAGHSPNLQIDMEGQKLSPDKKYNFDLDGMHFIEAEQGIYIANHIKFLRLCFSGNQPQILQKIDGAKKLAAHLEPLVNSILQNYIRI